MKVQDLMTEAAATCRQDDSLSAAAGTMWHLDCGALPVVDDDGSIVGMITDRDICMAAYTLGRKLDDLRVEDFVKGEAFSVAPQDTVQQAEEVMRQRQIRRVPVVHDGNQVVGILSLNDIAREGQRERSQAKSDITSDEVMQTLAAISQPKHERVHPPR